MFDAPVKPVPSWAPENEPQKKLFAVPVERIWEGEMYVLAYTREEVDAIARAIAPSFFEDWDWEFETGITTYSAREYEGKLGRGEPIYDEEWTDAP